MAEGGGREGSPIERSQIQQKTFDQQTPSVGVGGQQRSHEKGINPKIKITTGFEKGKPSVSTFQRFREMMTGRNLRSFIDKVNSFSWDNIQKRVMENYDNLAEPVEEFYPRMKTGFQFFKGDNSPLEGADSLQRSGQDISFIDCVKMIQEQHSERFFIIGPSGSGKSTLMGRLAKHFIINNQLHQGILPRKKDFSRLDTRDIHIVLYSSFRYLSRTCEGTLSEILFNPQIIGLTKLEVYYGVEAILKKKIHAILLLDGMDEAPWLPEFDRRMGPWEKASTPVIFGNILTCHLLPHVSITISSREHLVAILPPPARPLSVVALVGFSEENAKSLYCALIGADAVEDWDTMCKYSPALHSMCLNPQFLVFYAIAKKRYSHNPPDCVTGVMINTVLNFIESTTDLDSNRAVGLLENLQRMAFHGMKEKRFVFSREDLLRFALDYDTIFDIGLTVPGYSIFASKIIEGVRRIFFAHLTLQEILTALHVVRMKHENFIKFVDEEFSEPSWSWVRSYTSGILNNKRVRITVEGRMFKIDDVLKKWDYLVNNLQTQFHSTSSSRRKLDILVALEEANALEILGPNAYLDFSNSFLTVVDMKLLASTLNDLEEVGCLSVANSGMDDELLQALATGSGIRKRKIRHLDVSGNHVITKKGFAYLGRIVENCVLAKLSMSQIGLTPRKFHVLNTTSGSSTIPILDVSKNPDIGNDEFSGLSNFVNKHNVEELKLSSCGLTRVGFEEFDTALGDAKIAGLDISDNHCMDEDGFAYIGTFVRRRELNILKMGDRATTRDKIESFYDALRSKSIRNLEVTVSNVWDNLQRDRTGDLSEEFYPLLTAICKLSQQINERLLVGNFFPRENLSSLPLFHGGIICIIEGLILLQDYIHNHHVEDLTIDFGIDTLPQMISYETSEEYATRLERSNYFQVLAKRIFSVMPASQDSMFSMLRTLLASNVRQAGLSESRIGRNLLRRIEAPAARGSRASGNHPDSEIFVLHSDRIELAPIETRIDVYKRRHPNLIWQQIGKNLVKSREMPAITDPGNNTEFTRRFASSLESCRLIGPAGGQIVAGDCSVEFQQGTFDRLSEVTVVAKVDSAEWPEGGYVISPSLDVNVGEIRKAARVKLSVWVIPDESYEVDIMHFSSTNNEWDIIKRCRFGDRRVIEFKCKNFSKILARLVTMLSLPIRIAFRPSFYVQDKQFVVILHLDDKGIRDNFTKFLNEQHGRPADIKRSYRCIDLKKGDTAGIRLYCLRPSSGFEFIPRPQFSKKIDDKLLKGEVFYRECTLESDSHQNEQSLIIAYDSGPKNNLEQNTFRYTWKPDYQGLAPSETPIPESSGTSVRDESKEASTPTAKSSNHTIFNGPVTFQRTANLGSGDNIQGSSMHTLNKGKIRNDNQGCTSNVTSSSQIPDGRNSLSQSEPGTR